MVGITTKSNIGNPIVREKDACEQAISVPLIGKVTEKNEETTNRKKRKPRKTHVKREILCIIRSYRCYDDRWLSLR
jgi:hypothetical protein